MTLMVRLKSTGKTDFMIDHDIVAKQAARIRRRVDECKHSEYVSFEYQFYAGIPRDTLLAAFQAAGCSIDRLDFDDWVGHVRWWRDTP